MLPVSYKHRGTLKSRLALCLAQCRKSDTRSVPGLALQRAGSFCLCSLGRQLCTTRKRRGFALRPCNLAAMPETPIAHHLIEGAGARAMWQGTRWSEMKKIQQEFLWGSHGSGTSRNLDALSICDCFLGCSVNPLRSFFSTTQLCAGSRGESKGKGCAPGWV